MTIETRDGRRGMLIDVTDPGSLAEGLREMYQAIVTLSTVVGAAVALAHSGKSSRSPRLWGR